MREAPDLSNTHIAFAPESRWYDGAQLVERPDQLIDHLKASVLADFVDGNGNGQAAVRLDLDADDPHAGVWVSAPTGTDWSAVDAAVASFAPVEPAAVAEDPLVPASLAVSTAVAAAIATVTITSPNLTTAQKASIKTKVEAQVQAVVDAHFEA